MTSSSQRQPGPESGPVWFAMAVRFFVAPVVFLLIGFFTADFLLSGVYTWPRTSRTVVMTLTAVVLSYEFVFKEQRAALVLSSTDRAVKALVYSCLIPYAVGFLALMSLTRLGS